MLQQKFVDLFARGSDVALPVAERDVVLTYVLRILVDVGLLDRLVFKGGTCVRKVFLERAGRFSEDLDFTAPQIRDPDDLILTVAEVFDGKTYHDIAFSVNTEDFYVRQDRLACGARIGYAHAWNPSAQFALDVSLREEPILGPRTLPLITDSYFKYLEIEPPAVTTLCFEEIVAEKIRASYQRTTTRDVYDLFQFQQRPFDRDLVRTLTVLKCWLVGDTFDPDRFFANIQSGRYEWEDLARLIRKGRRPQAETVITGCVEGYHFLENLAADEAELATDSYRQRQELFGRIVKRLSTPS
jgi:predicted nucleotidyltransferase component of viral defense system